MPARASVPHVHLISISCQFPLCISPTNHYLACYLGLGSALMSPSHYPFVKIKTNLLSKLRRKSRSLSSPTMPFEKEKASKPPSPPQKPTASASKQTEHLYHYPTNNLPNNTINHVRPPRPYLPLLLHHPLPHPPKTLSRFHLHIQLSPPPTRGENTGAAFRGM